MATQPSSGAEDVATIDVLKADELVRSGDYGYLDVRTEEEFKKGHVDVENPLNIAYMFNTPQGRVKNPNFLEQVMAVCNKDDHLVVGCQSGVRSVYATVDLQNIGFKHLYNMGGGYLAWVQNGLAVTKPEAEIYPTLDVIKPIADNGLPGTGTETKTELKAENDTKDNADNANGLPVIENESNVEIDLPATASESQVDNSLAVNVMEPKVEL